MKTITTTLRGFYLVAMFMALTTLGYAQTFQCYIDNDITPSSSTYEFDIKVKAVSGSIKFSDYQVGLLVNSSFVNGGTITASILSYNGPGGKGAISWDVLNNMVRLSTDTSTCSLTSTVGTSPVAVYRILLTNTSGTWGCFAPNLEFNFGNVLAGDSVVRGPLNGGPSPWPTRIAYYASCSPLNDSDITAQGSYNGSAYSVAYYNSDPTTNAYTGNSGVSNLANNPVGVTYAADVDGDGYLDPTNLMTSCSGPPGGYFPIYTLNTLSGDSTIGFESTPRANGDHLWDCNDNNVNVHPGVQELCNGIDDNCNGLSDEGVTLNIAIAGLNYICPGGSTFLHPYVYNPNLNNPTGNDSLTYNQFSADSAVGYGNTPYQFIQYSWSVPATTEDVTVNSANTYTVTVHEYGCTGSANVTVTQPTISQSSATSCDSYSWNSNTYTASGSYSFDAGPSILYPSCDSVANLTLTINHSSTSSTSVTQCNSYTWTAGTGLTYTTSGTYTHDAAPNSKGCDSLATLVLTINYSSTSSSSITHCNSYNWNSSTYTTSGTYTFDAAPNSVGCDSIATLVLTINYSSTSSTAVTACSPYSWNNSSYTSSGTYTYDVGPTSNSNSCDSVATLQLTISGLCPATLKLTMFIEGYYCGYLGNFCANSGAMQNVLYNEGVENSPSNDVDTVTISLVDPSNGNRDYVTQGILQTDGSLTVVFPSASIGNNYYIYINHRNSLETSSRAPVLINVNTSYDFSTSSCQAFGCNETQVDVGVWAIFTGDDNQDLFIDPYDFPAYDADNSAQVGGVYVNTDFNGDGLVDPFDFPVYDHNNSIQATANVPYN